MKILLINPKIHTNLSPGSFPLGLGYVGAILKKHEHTVEALDIRGNNYSEDEVEGFLINNVNNYDVICIGGMITVYLEIKKLISLIKKIKPSVPIIVGGTAASSVPHLVLSKTDADILCIGEGEISVIEILDTLAGNGDLKQVKGIAFKKEGEICFNPPRELIQDLDSVPFPLWDIFPMEKYINAQLIIPRSNSKGINLISGRGCPFRCIYCYRNFGNSVRMRSVDNVINEIKELNKKFGITHFEFQDELFTINKARVREFCNKLITEKMDITWRCLGRADLVDYDSLVLMKKAGCHWIGYGMESGSQKMLDIMQKNLKVDQIKNAIRISRQAGLEVTGTFMIGLPGESVETINETIQFCKEMKIFNDFFFTVPYPGTKLYTELIKSGAIIEEEDFVLKLSGDMTGLKINMTPFSDDELFNLKRNAEKEILDYLLETSRREILVPEIHSKFFSLWEDPQVNEKILTDLSTIVSMIRTAIPNTEDIILTGGFGRGEGSVLYENSMIRPVNDYDFVIISKIPLDYQLLKSLSEKIATTIGIRFIDLINISIQDIKSLPYTMFNYDLKYGGTVIFGDTHILDSIPEMDPARMPLTEGKDLLFNRLICMIECFNYDFLRRNPTTEEKFFLVNQCNKVILACCDTQLILAGKYHHSYREKNIRFQTICSSEQNLRNFVDMATHFKLAPTTRIDFDVINYWFGVKKIYLAILLGYLNKTFVVSDKFSEFKEFSRFYSDFSFNSTKSNLELAEIFTLLSINNDGIDVDYLNMAKERVMSITGQDLVDCDWEKLRKECTRLWFRLNH
jgi:anaerobic magnesium-protoporphyrin IX monomethyl ester cyclase